ncbi:MAG: hypothetical protein H6660_03475 [Ardenticatenaceae bacterium]|nr:hypothetical protein [Ardenticatenaceae bacterium]
MQKKPFTTLEIVMLALLAAMVVISLLATSFFALTGTAPLLELAACLGPGVGAGLGAVLIAMRRRAASSNGLPTVIAAILLLVGMSVMGTGVFTLSLGDATTASAGLDFGMTMALCFAPGGFLSLLGLGAYWSELQRRKHEDEGGGVASAQTGRAAGETAVSQPAPILEKTANSNVLRYQAQLARAGLYRQKILEMVQQNPKEAFQDHLLDVGGELQRWEERLQQLVRRLTAYEENEVVQQDVTAVPQAIANLERQLAAETDPAIRAEIEQTLGVYQQQQVQLNALHRLMRRTQLDLEETVAAMGTLYSQMEVLGAKEIDSGRAQRLSHDVSEQVHRLNDLLTAVDEVYTHTSYQ